MTTIAFDGRTMAADRQMTDGSRKVRFKSKLRKLQKIGALAGFAGDIYKAIQLGDWLNGDADLPGMDNPEDIEALVAFSDGRIMLYNGLGQPVELDEEVYAIGSGGDYALAAMELGKTAEEAVRYAMTRDGGSGFGVEVIEFTK